MGEHLTEQTDFTSQLMLPVSLGEPLTEPTCGFASSRWVVGWYHAIVGSEQLVWVNI